MRKATTATAAALLLLLAGCAQETAGSPLAADEPTGTEQTTTDEETPSSESTEPSEPADGGLSDVKPCDLADQTARTALGLTGGDEKKSGEARVCGFRKQGATLNDSFTVRIEIFDEQGFADIVATDTKTLPRIGGHDAAQFTGTTGGCVVSLAVTEKSRVDTTVVGGDPQQGCTLATQVATAIEPNLPAAR